MLAAPDETPTVVSPADVVVLDKNIAQIVEAHDESGDIEVSSSNGRVPEQCVPRSSVRSNALSLRARWRRVVLGDDPGHKYGMVYHYAIMACIILDVMALTIETMDGPNKVGAAPEYPGVPKANFFAAVEVLITFILTVDLLFKCMLAPSPKFFYSGRLLLDVLSLVSLYLLVLYTAENPLEISAKQNGTIDAIKTLRYFRLLRIMHMMKGLDGMIVLIRTARASIPPLQVTLFFLITFVMMFATMLFYAQPCYNASTCTFTDIFNAGYFVMVTVATVGYGDQLPDIENIPALVITCVIMIFGTLYLAMPLAIIGIHYETTWIDFQAQKIADGAMTKPVQPSVEDEAANFERMESTELSTNLHSLNAKFLELCDLVTRVSEHAVAITTSIEPARLVSGSVNRERNGKFVQLINEATHAIKLQRTLAKEIKPFVPKDLVTAQAGKKPVAQSARTSSFSKSIVSRAKRAISNIQTKSKADEDANVKRTLRERVFQLMERPHSSTQANYVNKFFLAMVICSVLMFYAETTPELQAHGIESDLCHEAFASYCENSKDVGCYMRSATNEPTTQKLNFHCDAGSSAPDCFGSGLNYGANATLSQCYDLFSDPRRICEIRQCKPGHEPMYDMTRKWVYLEYYFGLVFTIEMALRFYAARNRVKHLRSIGTYIDVVAVLPFYVQALQGVVQARVPTYAIVPTFPQFLTVLPIVKPIRIFKLARHFKSTSVLSRTTQETWKRLLIPLFFLFLGCVSAGAIFYEIERGTTCYVDIPCFWWNRDLWTKELDANLPPKKMVQIQVSKYSIITDMLRSSWLSIATLTSVGYGDMKPRTPLGRLFDIVAMVFGSFYTAMPLSLVGTQFYLAYRDFLESQKNQHHSGSLSVVRPSPGPSLNFRRHKRRPPSMISQDDVPVLSQFMTMSRLLNEILQMACRLNAAQKQPASLGTNELPVPPLLVSMLKSVKTARKAGRIARRSLTSHDAAPRVSTGAPQDVKLLHIEGMCKNMVTSTSLCQTILLQFSIIVHKIVVPDKTLQAAESPQRAFSSFRSRSETSRRESDSNGESDSTF
ncbi:hypothetical protein SPRG_01889 [Saprolegnia parasitica CBS 223.65]|uniref:Ion transport domain-containing protein n=1 Tax=Saprolegnia parasitica (strain CBS 223.65) TaxID=695850 RepID=A0A067CQU8_SAPPC|nr:hypothetical protein SPRG_01889 [Saprolegnia parasitica CBS 223.65]KDO33074.1 hypothetical protein SPRG_01889 [Saprolegnia parasitica CBS 223.65]|eukprot:XP_012195845.1 hypothetical protein SPRG_01889 [Saprolegnia parasitica CBS 223.65]